MRDQDDGFAFVAQFAKDAEEVICLVGRQDAGGLVENEGFGAAIERFQNFDALLLAD